MKEDNKAELLKSDDDKEERIEDNKITYEDNLQKEEEENNEIINIENNNEIQEEGDVKILIEEEDTEEKERLIGIIDRLKEDLDSPEYKSLGQIYEQYLNNEDMTKKNIKPGTTRKTLCIMFYIVSPLFGIINLVGIFQSISMMKIIFQILKNSLKNYYISLMKESKDITKFSINDYIKQYEYFEMFINNVKNETFDFNLMMLMAFLGDILLKSRGFRISISVFAALNIGAIFLILNFSFEDYDRADNTYTIFNMLYLFLTWLLLFVGVGASALLSQQIIIDGNYKYDKYISKLNEETEKKIKMKKDKWEKKKQEKKNLKENKDSALEYKIDDLEYMNLDEDTENEKENNTRKIKGLSVYNKNNENIKYQKKKSEEINIKNIAEDFVNVKNESQNFIKAQTFAAKNILETKNRNKNKKTQRKKSAIKVDSGNVKKKKFNSFFMICVTTISGYFLKYLLNLTIIGASSKLDNFSMQVISVIINQGTGVKCELDSDCLESVFNDTNLTINNSMLFDNLVNYISRNDERYKPAFYYMALIYVISVILSIILYSIFICIFTKNKKETNVNGNSYKVCEICGYTIYSENIILNLNPPCCECCKILWCGTCKNCINMVIGSLLCCFNENIKNNVNICRCCKCCEKNKIDYKKNKEFFCYCYQAKRKHYWFNKFITSDTQKKIFPYMLEYFYLQLLTIAFESQYNNILDNELLPKNKIEKKYFLNLNNLKFMGIFLGTFFLYFYFTLSFNTIINLFRESKTKGINLINKISNEILDGAHGILIFDSLFSLVLSALFLSKKYDDIFKTQNLIFVPILMNKFYYFTLIFFCVSFSEEKKKFELISGSTLISIYLTLGDLIISLIRDHSSLNALYITQIVFSSLPSLFVTIFILVLFLSGIFSKIEFKDRLEIFFCLFSFCLCFGGFWFKSGICDKMSNCDCDSDLDCYCCFECLDYCNCGNCCDFICFCECCNCCECYDCCGCCDCFYCCGDRCLCNC